VLPEDLSSIIGNDLRNSGFFEPIARQNMISLPAQPAEVIFRDWKALGAQYLLIGNVRQCNGQFAGQLLAVQRDD
jgi:TolB protein